MISGLPVIPQQFGMCVLPADFPLPISINILCRGGIVTSRNQHVHTRQFLISKKYSLPRQTHGINGPTPSSTFRARLDDPDV